MYIFFINEIFWLKCQEIDHGIIISVSFQTTVPHSHRDTEPLGQERDGE